VASWVLALLQLYVFLWVADFYEEFADAVAVVALQHNEPILVCSPTSAKRLQFVCYVREVGGFFIHAVDDCGGSAEFSGFKPYANPLLLFLYFPTDA
jgi:hypothetical protein